MKIITSQKLIDKYGSGVLDLVKKLGTDIDVLPVYDAMTVKQHCDTVNDDILIFGGPDVIPFFTLMNPANGDPDQTVLSDSPYATGPGGDPTYLVPNKALTRLPDEQANWKIDFIEAMVDAQAGFLTVKTQGSGWFNMVASVWKNISDFMNTTFNMGNQNVVPPVTSDNLDMNQVTGKAYAYVNTHGTKATPFYYGQSGGTYPIALKPVQGAFKGTICFFESCYGGWLEARDRTQSIPLMALFSGCLGTACSTEVAYGPSGPPPQAADLLALKFYNHIVAGEPLGKAFMNAKIDFATTSIQSGGALDPEAKKTLLEFHLYGHPLVVV